MIVTQEDVKDYEIWYSKVHTLASTRTYMSYIRRFVGFESEINQKKLNNFRDKYRCCASSGALKSFFRFLVDRKNFPDDILKLRFDKNKQTRKLPSSISYQEVEALINNMPTLRTKVLTLFTYELGLRISESLKIKWEDFNWAEWLTNRDDFGSVDVKNTKRGKSRVMPVKAELMNLLYGLAKTKSQIGIPIGLVVFDFGVETFIFRKEFSNEKNRLDYLDFAKQQYRNILEKVSNEILNKKISPHKLRHSKAQFLMDRGMPIESLKNFLGHELISTTEIYAQASPEKVKRDLRSFDIFKNSQMPQNSSVVQPG